MRVEFNQLPENGRVWVFAAERPLSEAEQQSLLAAVDQFLEGWTAHGRPLAAARDLRYGQFLIVGVDESEAGPSGCSIDAMTRRLAELERQLGVQLQDHAPVFYRHGGRIARTDRGSFANLVAQGHVTPDTVVFNNTVARVGDVMSGRWETPARNSWHAKLWN